MKWRKISNSILLVAAVACLWGGACGGGNKANQVLVSVSPSGGTLLITQFITIAAIVTGATDTSVTWACTYTTQATGATQPSAEQPCTTSTGNISNQQKTTVTFTAPSTFPDPTKFPGLKIIIAATATADTKKTAKATITLDSGIRASVTPATATVGTNESFLFHAILSGDPTDSVTWSVKEGTTAGSVDSSGNYKAPATVPTTPTATVIATSTKDPSRTAQATVTIVDSKNKQIAFTGINPTTVPLGGVLQDIYLQATNLRSTVTISYTAPLGTAQQIDPGQLRIIPLPAGVCTASSTITCPASVLARLRLTSAQLSTPGTFTVSISFPDPNNPANTLTVNQTGTITPYRPSIIASIPDSFQQNSNPSTGLILDGGLFGSVANPAVSVQFNGSARSTQSLANSGARKLTVNLNSVDLAQAGLFSVSVVNNKAFPSIAATNVAVQPDFTGQNGPANPVNLLSPPLSLPDNAQGVHPEPSAIAIDSTLGYAVVSEQATNAVQLININSGNPVLSGLPVTVGTAPTGVAIDDQLVQPSGDHVAVVVNSGSNSLSLVGIPSGTVINQNVDLSGLFPTTPAPTPYAVGVDPNTHLALVAFSSSNAGFVVDLNPKSGNTCLIATQSPPCAISTVTLNTGGHPQIAFEPGIHWAFVTPGGAGQINVVDLTQKSSTATVAAAPSGAVRSNNVVTIKTTGTHGLNPLTPGTVLVSGITPADFNGSFTVLQVLDSQTFTYSQTGADETGGGGSIRFNAPFLTFNVSNTIQGIAINPKTRTVVLADPNAGGNGFSSPIDFISTLDQNTTGLPLSVGSFLKNPGSGPEIGAQFVAFQPFTNVALSLNPARSEVSVLDPVAPQRLAPATSLFPAITAGSYTPAGSTTPVPVNGAIAVDPATNIALVANAGTSANIGNTISVLQLGTGIKSVHISQILVPENARVATGNAFLAQAVRTSPSPVTIKILGSGFNGTPQVRLDGVALTTPPPVSDREIDIDIPITFSDGTPILTAPRRFALDVVNNNVFSNVTDFTVVGVVDVSAQCTGTTPSPQPFGVAIDEVRKIAVVTNNGCVAKATATVTNPGTVSIIDLDPEHSFGVNPTYGTVVNTTLIGAAPTGVAVVPRLGLAVVANNAGGTASILDIHDPPNTKLAAADVVVGTSPNGVAINQDSGIAYVANTGSNTLSGIDLNPLTLLPAGKLSPTSAPTDQTPIAVAIDADAQTPLAAVTTLQASGSGLLDIFDISKATASRTNSVPMFNSAIPTGIVFDPAAEQFYITASGFNAIISYDPNSGQTRNIPVGINPTSLGDNYQMGGILTVNSGSNTVSLIDSQTFKTRETLGISGSSQFTVAIHPRTNLAVITDQVHNRVILLPLP